MLDSRSIPLGTALFSDTWQIARCVWSRSSWRCRARRISDDVRRRVGDALNLRDQLAPTTDENNACRLIFSEAVTTRRASSPIATTI